MLCETGKFKAANGSDACSDCTAGKYSVFEGSTACQLCAAGKYKADDGTNAACGDCGPGHQAQDSSAASVGDAYDIDGASQHCVACAAGRLDEVNSLLAAGEDPNIVGTQRTTPLFIACERECPELVAMLLAARADPDLPAFGGATPLFIASTRNQASIAGMLADANAQLDFVGDNDYYTPLLACTKRGSDDVAKVEGGRLKPEEVELFKKILASIAKSEDQAVPIDELRDGKGKLANPQFDAFVEGLVEARWLDKKADDFDVLFGPRSFLELADVIRDHGAEVPQMINY